MIIICSYPRSGSTWLRFILCNLLYPETEHDIDSVNRHIPDIDHYDGMKESIHRPHAFKSHGLRQGQSIIFLHRHVGDVLISEWWYKKKYHADTRTLEQFLEDCKYGENWRAHIDHFFPAERQIGYDELSDHSSLLRVIPKSFLRSDLRKAMRKSSFTELQHVEKKGFGQYPSGDLEIPFFRQGTSDQWKDLKENIQDRILYSNLIQLKALGYL